MCITYLLPNPAALGSNHTFRDFSEKKIAVDELIDSSASLREGERDREREDRAKA